ncbi:MAG TPA: hypothetical protein VEJ46_15850 [Candidatus Acidoferrum sp.]|nr:hypothetical protein [Candidatus Acidoferrum sp.]
MKLESGAATVSPLSDDVKALSELLAAIAWPTVFGILIVTQRKSLAGLLVALTGMVQSSKRIRLGDIIDVEVDRSAAHAEISPPGREVPKEELAAADRVSRLVTESELPTIRAKMLEFAHEYEATRSDMKPGPERTRVMNAIVAKMRTLALAAKPLLSEFLDASDSPGKRLAAITILQLSPSLHCLEWLADRMSEEQPFVFFHASLALLAAVRLYARSAERELRSAVSRALKTVKSFKGGPPDRNTIDALELALSELGGVA